MRLAKNERIEYPEGHHGFEALVELSRKAEAFIPVITKIFSIELYHFLAS